MTTQTTSTQNQSSGGDFYINIVTGTIQQQHNPLLGATLRATGFLGPFATIQDAKNARANIQSGLKHDPFAPGAAAAATGNPLTGIAAIGDFFQRLTQPETWIRVGEFVAGGLLLYLGLSASLRGTTVQQGAQQTHRIAKTAVKVGKKAIK